MKSLIGNGAFLGDFISIDAEVDVGTMRFGVIIERDPDGLYVGSVPDLPGCHTQARTLDELMQRMKEAVELYLEVAPDNEM